MRPWSVACFLLPMGVVAQHCPYDFQSIIVVHPVAEGDTALVEGLRISLLEKDNLPAQATGVPTYLFTRNTEWSGRIPRRTFRRQGHRMFPFAGNNYILMVPNHFHMDNYKILVQDERPGNDGPRYRMQVMHLDPSQSHPLCGRYDALVYPVAEGEPAFTPILIYLFEQ